MLGCESQKPIFPEIPPISDIEPEVLDIRPLSEQAMVFPTKQSEIERVIADVLFEGLQALEDDRLLTPLEDNAYSRFQRVLALDNENQIAKEGVEKILLRYVALSQQASRRGLFDNAEELLGRAKFIDEDHPALAQALSLLK